MHCDGDADDDYGGVSCRRLETCVTEFGAQGLELDAALLGWGTDQVSVRVQVPLRARPHPEFDSAPSAD